MILSRFCASRVARFSLSFVVAVALAACQSLAPTSTSGVTLFHLNDTYRLDALEEGTRGGFARVVTLIREAQREGRNVVVLHGGDFLYPSLESELFDGAQMVAALNFIHDIAPLYLVPGNHEFDRRSPAPVVEAVRQSRFSWVADNLRLVGVDPAVAAKIGSARIVSVAGIDIGLFALTLHAGDGGHERDYLRIGTDYEATARRALGEIDDAAIIIGLTHLNLRSDLELSQLKRDFPAFRLIAGGHEHEPEFHAETPTSALVLKGASNARTVFRIDLDRLGNGTIDLRTTRIEVDRHIDEDADYLALAADWRRRLVERMPWLGAAISRTDIVLDGREESIRNQETALGNYLADRMREAFRRQCRFRFAARRYRSYR